MSIVYTMNMTTFIFVRHGKSQANADNLIATDDTPLTKEGESQARRVGRELRGKKINYIVSSPFDRARKTAEIIAKQLKLRRSVEVIDDLRERGFGELEGKPKDHESSWYAIADGESDIEPRGVVIARVEAALGKIKKLAEEGEGQVLVVGHGVAGFYLQQVAAGKRYIEQFADYKQPSNATPTTVVINPVKSQPIAVKPKLLASFIAIVVGIALLITGIAMLINQQNAPLTDKKLPDIPLSPQDYNGDPHLQNAIQQQLQEQSGSAQSQNDASHTLQPAPQGLLNR